MPPHNRCSKQRPDWIVNRYKKPGFDRVFLYESEKTNQHKKADYATDDEAGLGSTRCGLPEIDTKPDQKGADNNKKDQVSHSNSIILAGKDNPIIADIFTNERGVCVINIPGIQHSYKER